MTPSQKSKKKLGRVRLANKEAYHISETEGKRPNLSVASLGKFVYHVLKSGADISAMGVQ